MSFIVVGGMVAGGALGLIGGAGAMGVAALIAAGGVGGFLAKSSNRDDPTYEALDYGQTMSDSLRAQIALAPELYEAEADPEYGRAAFARLEQQIAIEGLLGREIKVDSDGYTRKIKKGSIPKDADFVVQNEFHAFLKAIDPKANPRFKEDGEYYSDTGSAELRSKLTPEEQDVVLTYFDVHPIYGVYSADNYATNKAVQLDDGGAAYLKQRTEEGYFDGRKDAEVRAILEKHGYEIPAMGTAYDADQNLLDTPAEITQTYVGIDKAGQTVREGGGLLDLITGGRTEMLPDGKGGKVERKIGFDADGNFLGLNALQQDLDNSNQRAKIVQELQLIKDHGEEFTEAYRSQGDIKKALEDIKYLTRNESAIPDSKIDSGGTALFDYATGGTKPTGAAAEEMSGGVNPNSLSEKTKPKQIDKVQKLYSERLDTIDAEYNYLIEQGLDKAKADAWKEKQIAIHKERAKSAGYDEFGNPLLAKDETVITSTLPTEEVTPVESAQPTMASTPDGQLTEGVREIGYGDAPEKVTTTEGFEKVSTDADFSEVTADQTNVDITTDFDARDVDVDFKGDYTARDVTAESLGNMSGLRTSLLDEAKDELELGGDLSEREIRAATQLARQSRTAMGRGRDTGAILEELRLNQKLSNERKLQRQSFATMVAGQEGRFREIETGQQLQAGISNQNKDLQINQQFLTEQGQRLTQGMANQNKDLTLNQQTTAGENLALQQDTDNANRKLQADTTNVQTEKDEFAFKQRGKEIKTR